MRGKETGYKKYQEIIADYNREKDRATVEATFAQLVALAASLDTEQRRAAEEGLSDDELALFDLLFKQSISKADRERLKQASKSLLHPYKHCSSRCRSGPRTARRRQRSGCSSLTTFGRRYPDRPSRTRKPKPSRVVCMTTSGSEAPAGECCWSRARRRRNSCVKE